MKSGPTLPNRVASIDIGTNTILLLIAEMIGGEVKPLREIETIVRLGEGAHKKGILSEEAMERGFQTLFNYLEQCQALRVQKIFAVGTSALREAKNSGDFLKKTKEKLDLSIQIISGEEEAQLSFLAVVRDLKEREQLILVVDIGGGSTEFIIGREDRIIQWDSFPMGSVRFTEEFLHSDPVQEEEWGLMEKEIRRLLGTLPPSKEPISMVAVGGTATTLASVEQGLDRFIFGKIHHFILEKEALKKQVHSYRSKTIRQRREIPGLHPERAEVILAGGTILYLAMEAFNASSVLTSCHGVRYGLLYKKIADFGLRISD